MMKFKINTLNLIGALISGLITFTVLSGQAQKVVHFAGVENEIGTAFLGIMLTLALIGLSFEKVTKN